MTDDVIVRGLLSELKAARTEQDLLRALRSGIQQMAGVSTVWESSIAALDVALEDRTLVAGPYTRTLPDGRRQYYAYVR